MIPNRMRIFQMIRIRGVWVHGWMAEEGCMGAWVDGCMGGTRGMPGRALRVHGRA
eukprot:jgi/Botrbrau1/2470/Bobra.0226s0028.1